MKLAVLGSSSRGNGYLLDNGKEALLIECGCNFDKVKKVLNGDILRLCGAIVSHEHGDHAKHLPQVLGACIPCYMSKGTAEALKIQDNHFCKQIGTQKAVGIGGFTIQAFDVQHDAADPFGFLIHHKETGTILFATDTYYLKYKFKGLNNILIECNYRKDILDDNMAKGRISIVQRNRVLQSHLSYQNCLETLLANDLSKVNNIVLIHLSDGNSNADEFQQGIKDATCSNVHIATSGMEIEFNNTPF